MTKDEFVMMKCIELAQKGAGYVSPNPLVGCVIVKDGKIAAEGFHKKFGRQHAEINAINNALNKRIKLKGAVLYANLEPCYHFGKTPPCVDRIIELKFSKVVIGCKDPNPRVSGKSIRKLRNNGIKVLAGVLENECRTLNKFFIKHITTGLPYITLKAAQTFDGKIARADFSSKWISSEQSRKIVHKMRSEYDAVLVGSTTVRYDDPELTVRLVKGRNPLRIIIDKDLRLWPSYRIFSGRLPGKTIVLTSKRRSRKKAQTFLNKGISSIICKTIDGIIDLEDAMRKLGKLGVSSLMVEGGAETYSHFLSQKLVDEMIIFVSPRVFGSGVPAFKESGDFSKYIKTVQKVGNDFLFKLQLKEY